MIRFAVLIVFILLADQCYAITDTIRLSPYSGEFSQVGQDLPATPYPNNHPDLAAIAWTNNQVPVIGRGYFRFDLSGIPPDAINVVARLSLYANPFPFNNPHSTLSGSNAAFIKRVVQSWSSLSCTWNNQPATTDSGKVYLPSSTSASQDYLNIDVSSLVMPMLQAGNNFGFCLMLENESYYRSLNFASGACLDSLSRPLLVVEYDLCPSYRYSDLTSLKDVVVSTSNPSVSDTGSRDFVAYSVDLGGTGFFGRSLLTLDSLLFPIGSTVQSAYLDLYFNTTNSDYPPTSLNGDNEVILSRTSQYWTPSQVSMNNLPTIAVLNTVVIPGVSGSLPLKVTADITSLVQDMILNPSQGWGLIMQLQNESGNRSMNFCSSNHPDSSLHPELRLCVLMSSSTNEQVNTSANIVYPNPTNGLFEISSLAEDTHVYIRDNTGRVQFGRLVQDVNDSRFDIRGWPAGIYLVSVVSSNNVFTSKLILNPAQ